MKKHITIEIKGDHPKEVMDELFCDLEEFLDEWIIKNETDYDVVNLTLRDSKQRKSSFDNEMFIMTEPG